MPFKDFSNTADNDNDNNGNGGGAGMPVFVPNNNSNNSDDATDMLINYNEKFKTNNNAVMFRDNVIKQVLSTLIALTKPNPLLIGSAGVGKTKIAEAIAYELANDTQLVPKMLKGYTIYELPLANIVAGSSFVGDLESKIKSVIEFASEPKNKVILFIDEIHQLVNSKQTYGQIAQILKPALARSDMKCIGATTLQEANDLMNDPALNRRFSRIIVDELTKEQTIEVLKSLKGTFFTHYGNSVIISDNTIAQCVELATFYAKAGAHRPDNAITLLDRAIGEAVIRRQMLEIKAQNDPQLQQALAATPMINVSEKHLKLTAIRLMTGNNEKNELDISALKNNLSVIKGQDEALSSVIYKINEKDKLPDSPEDEKPLVFMFAGTSGVGKTETARILAKTITDTPPIKLSMAEFHSPASINRIIGSPAGYIGSDSKGELPFDSLESNPYQVIILDEFEKCDTSVQRLFMEAFDEGLMKTAKGKEISFKKAIFIATTNAGFKDINRSLGFTQNDRKQTLSDTIQALKPYFDPELLNRIQSNGAIVSFNEISKETFVEILKAHYAKETARLKKANPRIKIADTLSDDEAETLAQKNYVPEFGARPVKGAIKNHIASLVL